MNEHDTCEWKLVDAINFRLGMPADRCGEPAEYKVIRKDRKRDLCLCSDHTIEWMRAYYCSNPMPVVKVEGGEL